MNEVRSAPLPPYGGIATGSSRFMLTESDRNPGMSAAATPSTLTIGAMEAGYPMYCKALRIMIREGKSIEKIQRSICWNRLVSLHHSLPRDYKDPQHLYVQLKRDIGA